MDNLGVPPFQETSISWDGLDLSWYLSCLERCRNPPALWSLEERLLAIGFNTIFDYLFLQGDPVMWCWKILELDWLVRCQWWVKALPDLVRSFFHQQMWHWTNHGFVSWGKVLCAEAHISTTCLLVKGKRAGCIYVDLRIESVKGSKAVCPLRT